MFGTALFAALSLLAVGTFFLRMHTPTMTTGRKQMLLDDALLPIMVVTFGVAVLSMGLATTRLGTARRALFGVSGPALNPPRLGGRALEVLVVGLILGLGTPPLQTLVGSPPETGSTGFFSSMEWASVSIPALFALALVEDIGIRWFVIEGLLALRFGLKRLAIRHLEVSALAISTLLAVMAHALPGLELPTWGALLEHGISKAPAAFAFAYIYLRRGAVQAWLTHLSTNFTILLLIPRLVGE